MLNPRLSLVIIVPLIVVLLPDIVLRAPSQMNSTGATICYFASAFASAILWLAIVPRLADLRVRHPWLGRGLTACFALFVPLLSLTLIGYYTHYKVDPSPSVFAFFINHPIYLIALTIETANWLQGSALLGLPFITMFSLDYLTVKPYPLPSRSRQLSEFVALGMFIFAIVFPSLTVSADLRAVATSFRGTVQWVSTKTGLPSPSRLTLSRTRPHRTPDVLLLLHESISAYQWYPWGCEEECSPSIARVLRDHSEHNVWFQHAVSSSSATDVSMPSFLTGLAPDAARDSYAYAPLIWHYARALGYRTALFTSQDWDFANFKEFFLDHSPPDVVRTADDYPEESRVNDNSLSDAVIAREAIQFIQEANGKQPLLMIVQFAGSHGPWYYPGSKAENLPGPRRYAKSARWVDSVSVQVYDALANTGRLENTVVISTSDHGENTGTSRPLRVENLDESVIRVPLWMHFPEQLSRIEPELHKVLKANSTARTGNIDVVPTLLDIWGLWPTTGILNDLSLAGHSLLRPIPTERLLVCCNTCEIRFWDREAVVMYRSHLKWLIDETGSYMYDLAADPGESSNQISEVSDSNKKWMLQHFSRRPALLRVLYKLNAGLGRQAEALRKEMN
jgi:hypothetical protein